MSSSVDLDLVEGLLARDEDRLREVIALYGGVVLGMARRVLAEGGMAEEVAQDTFLALWRRPGAFNPERGTLKSFLVTVARNKAIDLVRKQESLRRTKDQLLADLRTSVQPPGAGLENTEELKGSLKQIPAQQREAIVLAYFGGRTYREVAEELGIPEGTAKTRLRDGLRRLKEVMTSGDDRDE
ncbi:MAG TPA: sigma-70 family RNA polymerase sigma factor [Actinomycetota bacterium]|nr:sigma-70 family RNA polymerase sigma factor [Actinomycetota bacterium]